MSIKEILAQVAAGTLKAEDAAKLLPNPHAASTELSFRVSEKGAVSIYGLLSRFPVTLYVDGLERLIDNLDRLKAFIAENNEALDRKCDSDAVRAAKAKHPARVAAAKRAAESAKKRAAA